MKRTFRSYQTQHVIYFFTTRHSPAFNVDIRWFKSYAMIYQSHSHYFTDDPDIHLILQRIYFIQCEDDDVAYNYATFADAALEQDQSLCMLRHRDVRNV